MRFVIVTGMSGSGKSSVMKILEDEGSYIDAVSPGEIYTALLAGFTPERIVFTGNNVTNEELEYAHKTGVTINYFQQRCKQFVSRKRMVFVCYSPRVTVKFLVWMFRSFVSIQ